MILLLFFTAAEAMRDKPYATRRFVYAESISYEHFLCLKCARLFQKRSAFSLRAIFRQRHDMMVALRSTSIDISIRLRAHFALLLRHYSPRGDSR